MPRTTLSYLKNVILAAVGIPIGVLTGLTGLSLGPVLQPLLNWMLGITGVQLNGVVLACVSFCSWGSLLSYSQIGAVSWINGFIILIGTFVGTGAAAKSIVARPMFFLRSRAAWSFVPLVFAFLMIASAGNAQYRSIIAEIFLPHAGWLLPLVWCFIIGIIAGYIGQINELGSILVIPLLVFLLQQSIWQAEGTALFVLVLASLPTLLIHVLKGHINKGAALALSFGSVFGALYGSHNASNVLGSLPLTLLCGLVIVVLSLIKLFQSPHPFPIDSDNLKGSSGEETES